MKLSQKFLISLKRLIGLPMNEDMSRVLEIKFQMVCIAKEILKEEIDFFEGCRIMSGCVNQLRQHCPEECDSILMGFVGIDSELDTAILDPYVRSRYEPNALAENDAITAEYRAAITDGVLEDSREIIRRYDNPN